MLSISPPKLANNGLKYFEIDSYYQNKNEQGLWKGLGAKSLGLTGAITQENFKNILNGIHPDGTPLVRNHADENRRSYIDLTFSAPKSVSILSYGDDRIEAAHNAAVEKALEEVEKFYAITREGAGGNHSYRTGNIVVARFNHYESRELDPQLHTHSVLMNLTMGKDGEWRSMEMSDIFKNKMYIGQLYRNNLALKMQDLGYKINVTDRAKGFFDIEGVPKELIEEYSKRRHQVLEEKSKYEDYKISEAEKMAMATLSSRKYKKETTRDEVRELIRESLERHGQTLQKIVDESLKFEQGKDVLPNISIEECIEKSFEDITEHQSAFRQEQVINLALKNGLGLYDADQMRQAFKESSEVTYLGDKNVLTGKSIAPDVNFFSTHEIKETELGILKIAEEGKNASKVHVSNDEIDQHFKKLLEQGVVLSKGQRAAVEMVCLSRDNLNLVQGDSGAGKTFAVDHIRQIMEKNDYTVRGFAPTGKASRELKSANIETSTIHSFLSSKKDIIPGKELWIVDEAGMVGSRRLKNLLDNAQKYQAKVVLIGDSKQFRSVEQGKIFADLQKHATVGYAEITEVLRQKSAHMIDIVKDLKNKDIVQAIEKMEVLGIAKEYKDKVDLKKAVIEDSLNDRAMGKRSAILCSTNKDRIEINRSYREALVEQGLLDQGEKYQSYQPASISGSQRRYANSYAVGQRIIFQRECVGIERGTQGNITGLDSHKNTIIVRYWMHTKKAYEEKTLNMYDHATKINAYDRRENFYSKGDFIIALKNDKKLGLQNGMVGIIKSIDHDSGDVSIQFGQQKIKENELGSGKSYSGLLLDTIEGLKKGTEVDIVSYKKKERTLVVSYGKNEELFEIKLADHSKKVQLYENTIVAVNIKNKGNLGYDYFDHAHALTTIKSQGATFDSIRWAHNTQQRTNYQEAYVALTRVTQDAYIYTDSLKDLKEHAVVEQQKDSVIDFKDSTKKLLEELDNIVVSVSNVKHVNKENEKNIKLSPKVVKEIIKESEIKLQIEKQMEIQQQVKAPEPEHKKNIQGPSLSL